MWLVMFSLVTDTKYYPFNRKWVYVEFCQTHVKLPHW